MPRPPFELRILGPTELHGPDSDGTEGLLRQSKRLALLAYLALSTSDGFRRRDQVTAYFWPELDQAQARTYLRKSLYAIREALGQEVFLNRGEDEIRVDPALVWCDAVELSAHVRAGRWSEALSLYRGELLEGLFPEGVSQEFQDWLSSHRKQLRERAAQAAWECSRLEEERGDRTAAAVMARRARDLDPDNEEGVRRLMGLLDRRGDRGSALRVYAEWQARLQEEYGVEPAPETRRLARQVQASRKGESNETPSVQTPPPISVAAPSHALATPTPSPSGASTLRWWMVAALLVTVLALGAVAIAVTSRAAVAPGSVAVLPLQVIGDQSLEEAALAIGEEIITRIARDSALAVRLAPRPATTASNDLLASGHRLGVSYIIDGAIRGNGERIRVTIRLVRSSDAVALWAGQADIEQGDLIDGAERLGLELRTALDAHIQQTRRPLK